MSTGTLTPRGRHHRTAVLALPASPDDGEKASHSRRAAPRAAPVLLALAAGYLGCAQLWLELHDRALAAFGCYTVLFAASLMVSLPVLLAARPFSAARHQRAARLWKPATYPDVDIYLPVRGEPADVLENTWSGVFDLIRLYPGRARPFVLDDGPVGRATSLASDFGFSYLRRPDNGQDGKPGNLNFALRHSGSPFVAVLHADARPRDDFLAETLPYFTDPAVGIVQTPLFFRPPEGRSQARFTAARARTALWQAMQSCRGRFAAAQSAGSAAVYRRAALTAAGGFAAGSVARGIPAGSLDWGFAAGSVAGGFAAGSAAAEAQTVLGAQAAGYRLVYLPLPLAASLCPATAPTFARQQYRAAADIAAVVFSRRFWQVPLGLLDRLRYLACWTQRLLAGLRVVLLPLVPVAALALLPTGGRAGEIALVALSAIACATVLCPVWQIAPPVRQASWQLLPLAGWAQLLGSLDYLRFRARPASPPRLPLVRRCRSWLAGWNVILAVVWVVLACWRTGQTGSWLAAALALVGLGYLWVTARLVAELRPASDAPGASGG